MITTIKCVIDTTVNAEPVKIHGYALCAQCIAYLTSSSTHTPLTVERVKRFIDKQRSMRERLGIV